jgi:hypothetical protein
VFFALPFEFETHQTKMNSEEEMAQLSRDDVRLLRIVMQGAWQPTLGIDGIKRKEKTNFSVFPLKSSTCKRSSSATFASRTKSGTNR